MSKLASVAKIIGVILGVVLIGAFIGWLGSRGAEKTSVPVVPTHGAVDPGFPPQPATNRQSTPQVQRPTLPPVVQPVQLTTPPSNLITNWEDKVDEIIGPDTAETEKVRQLAEMFPRLPEDGQVEVANHLSNLVADEDYARIGNLLTNSTLPEAVLDVFLADLLNRPNSVKLPMLLQVAQDQQNPKAPEAKDLLELFLEEDFGNNWGQWQGRMQQWLQDNPD